MQSTFKKPYTASSRLGDLPGHTAALDWETPGAEVARIFKSHPELPGIMVTNKGERTGGLSQNRFLRLIGRPFGVELFYSRPMHVMMESNDDPMLTMSAECSISEGLERCLARATEDIYEPFMVEEPTAQMALIVDFRTLLMASNEIAALRNQQMERILSAVAEGLLTITADYVIGSEYSLALEQMLESKSIAGQTLPDLLSRFLDEKTCAEAREYLGVLFNARMIDRLIEGINPLREVTARFLSSADGGPGKVKEFSIRFRRMKQAGRVTQVLMRVEDVTRERALARELETQNARAEEQMQLLLQIMHIDPTELAQFLETFDFHLVTAAEWVQSNRESLRASERVDRIFRAIHSLKGEAGMLGLKQFQLRLHQYEETLSSVRKAGVNGDLGAESLSSLVPGLTELLRLSEGTKEAIHQFQKVGSAVEGEGRAKSRSPLLSSIEKFTAEISARLDRPAMFHSSVEEDHVPARYRSIFKDALIQLVRNSLTHGVETREERASLGKPAAANLQFEIREHPAENLLEAIYQDDGGGLDLQKIERRITELGWSWQSEECLKEVIFEPGFSTATEATMDAGRGVGLDLLKQRIEELGGRIRVHFERHAYCAFQILLPLQ